MLAEMLNIHPSFFVIGETHFIPVLFDKYGLDAVTFEEYFSVINEHYDSKGDRWIKIILETNGKKYERFKEEFEKFCGDIVSGNIKDYTEKFYMYISGGGCHAIFDKSPHYGTNMRIIKKIWPESKFIHILRDGVHVARSMIKHPGFVRLINGRTSPVDLDRCSYRGQIQSFKNEPVDILDAAYFYENVIRRIEEEEKSILPDDIFNIKYEDLVLEPYTSLCELSAFIGIEKDERWLSAASMIPSPFLAKNIFMEKDKKEYFKVFPEIKNIMQKAGYPVVFKEDISRVSLMRYIHYFKYLCVKKIKKILNKIEVKFL